jgi:ATP-dependent DNA helicase RecQ
MVKAVIFDFDLTLFNSSPVKSLMDTKQWSLVYKNIHLCSFYPYALKTLSLLNHYNIQTAIVSNAPSSYVKKILSFYNTDINIVICYHDVKNHKPSPEGIYKVLDKLCINSSEAIYVGDNDLDYKTACNANIDFFGVLWGKYSHPVKIIDYETFINSQEIQAVTIIPKRESREFRSGVPIKYK